MRVLRLQVLARQKNSVFWNMFIFDRSECELICTCGCGWMSSADFQAIVQKLGAKRGDTNVEWYDTELPGELLT